MKKYIERSSILDKNDNRFTLQISSAIYIKVSTPYMRGRSPSSHEKWELFTFLIVSSVSRYYPLLTNGSVLPLQSVIVKNHTRDLFFQERLEVIGLLQPSGRTVRSKDLNAIFRFDSHDCQSCARSQKSSRQTSNQSFRVGWLASWLVLRNLTLKVKEPSPQLTYQNGKFEINLYSEFGEINEFGLVKLIDGDVRWVELGAELVDEGEDDEGELHKIIIFIDDVINCAIETFNLYMSDKIRLVITFYTGFLQKKSDKIDIDCNSNTTRLLELISNRVGRPIKDLIVKYKRDGYTLKVLKGWPLSLYDFQSGQNCNVEIRETQMEQKRNENIRLNQRYLNKLGIQPQKLSQVSENSEEEDNDQQQMRLEQSKLSQGSFTHSEGEERQTLSNPPEERQTLSQPSREKVLQEQIFQAVKKGNLEAVRKAIEGETEVEEKWRVINEGVQAGWNPFHFAVFQNLHQIAEYFIQKGALINRPTSEGWSPLQMAIHKNNTEVLKVLLKQESLDVNQVTEKGLALNIACNVGRTNLISLLLQCGADPQKLDKNHKKARDCCSTEECYKLIEQYEEQQQKAQVAINSFQGFQPPRPPIVKGFMQKTGAFLLNTSERFFVLNPDEGTFIRYRTFKDYPLKPLEIIPLRNIRHVQMADKQWYMKADLFYFEIFYTSRIILATNFECSAKAWVSFIYQAAVYAIFIEDKMDNKIPELDFQQKPQEIEIKDASDKLDFAVELLMKEQQKHKKRDKDQEQPKQKEPTDHKPPQDTPTLPTDPKDNSDADLQKLVQDTKINFSAFEVIKILGSGAFGKVFLVKKKDDARIYAMKALKKRNLILKKQLKYAVTEANVLKNCNHPFILGLHFAFQTPNYLYLVLDYCSGGDLSYHIAQQVKFTEDDARFYIAELVLAIEYLHQLDVIYRDLKPENILLDKDGHIKLADFGLSKENVGDADKTKSFCGSPAYLSPEMLSQKGAGKASDIYGIGATLFEMVVGEPPYYSDDIPTMYKNIKDGQLKFPKGITVETQNFIKRLLERDPNKRLGAKSKDEIKQDPFFKNIDFAKVLRKEYNPPITDFSQMDDDDDDDDDDIGYKGKAAFNDYDYEEDNVKVNRVIKFSFARKSS